MTRRERAKRLRRRLSPWEQFSTCVIFSGALIGQVLSYMGDVADEESTEVRGILVAGEFDDKARAAARVVPGLSLRRYRVKFEFSRPEDTAPRGATG